MEGLGNYAVSELSVWDLVKFVHMFSHTSQFACLFTNPYILAHHSEGLPVGNQES